MKKKLLTFITAMFVLFAINQDTKAQTAIFVQGGYDWLDGAGVVGVQSGYWKASIGVFPTKFPGSGTPITGVCWAITWEGGKYDQSGTYLSIGQNSVGHRSETRYNGGSWGDKVVQPMWIAMLGYRMTLDNLYFKAGGGYGWSSRGNSWTYGIGLGYSFGI